MVDACGLNPKGEKLKSRFTVKWVATARLHFRKSTLSESHLGRLLVRTPKIFKDGVSPLLVAIYFATGLIDWITAHAVGRTRGHYQITLITPPCGMLVAIVESPWFVCRAAVTPITPLSVA